ncbi:hypothetical protein A2U01_0036438, partial [Trifolium medium]|nr:hypothetical protein [Trifolium medium]
GAGGVARDHFGRYLYGVAGNVGICSGIQAEY